MTIQEGNEWRKFLDHSKVNAAISAMNGMLASGLYDKWEYDEVAEVAVNMADSLIERLKKKIANKIFEREKKKDEIQ